MPVAKKTEEVKVSIELKGVKAKLQTARIALMEKKLKKSGKNDFAHFEFFQLKDFLPEAQRIFTKLGLTSNFGIMPRVIDVIKTETTHEPIIREIARLVISDIETKEEEIFEMEVAPVQIGNNTKQNIYQAAGGRSTYYKRYLYRDALEIEEDDESDMVFGNADVNYQTPVMQPQQPPVQPTTIQQDVVVNQQPTPQPAPQPVKTKATNPEDLISQESKEEVMKKIVAKGLNGFDVISQYCTENGIGAPNELKEKDKESLIAFVENNYLD